MKTLRIISKNYDGSLYNVNDPKEYTDSITRHYYKDHGIIVSNWWYLHGKLEDEIGYDKGVFCNLEDFNLYIKNCYFNGNKEYFDVVCLEDGIYDVEVIGIDKPCVGYFWITDKEHIPACRGLVCFKDDKEACEYAEQKYNEKSQYL